MSIVEFEDQNISMEDEGEQRGLTQRGKFFVTCVVISSFPVIIPSLAALYALGVMFSIPIGLFLTGYSFTDKIIHKIFSSSEPCLNVVGVENDMIAPKESFVGDLTLNGAEETDRLETNEVEAGKGCNDGRVDPIEMAKRMSMENEHGEDNSSTGEEKKDDLLQEEGSSSGDKVDCFDSTLKNNTKEIIVETSINGCKSSSSVNLFDVEAEYNARTKELEEKLCLVETVLGCRTGCELTIWERLNALFSIVGVTVWTRSDGSTGISELEEKLRYIMSVVGVK